VRAFNGVLSLYLTTIIGEREKTMSKEKQLLAIIWKAILEVENLRCGAVDEYGHTKEYYELFTIYTNVCRKKKN